MNALLVIALFVLAAWLFSQWAFADVPDIEEVPVVRCKDCAVPHNRWTGCPKMNGTVMPPDGFCSFGEWRK